MKRKGGVDEEDKIDITKLTPNELIELENKGVIELNQQLKADLAEIIRKHKWKDESTSEEALRKEEK